MKVRHKPIQLRPVVLQAVKEEDACRRPRCVFQLCQFIDRINAGKQSCCYAETVSHALVDGNEKPSCKKPAPVGHRHKYLYHTGDDPMTLREIVDDVELQRIAVLKDNAKRANQELLDARARLKVAKAKQETLRGRVSSVPVPSNRSYPHDTI
jgi:hypothetical protein